tara:strand:- start:205 stop:1140 length:936 start_codon:yes stop_codon:yes gene_type:complete
MKVAIQMDPIEGIDIEKDSTFALGMEAQKRGFLIYYYNPEQLIYKNNDLYAYAQSIRFSKDKNLFFDLSSKKEIKLSSMDVVLLRQDPPFNMNYITSTHFLERIHPKTLVVNDPFHVRNTLEKLSVLDFPDLIPETLITENIDEIRDFLNHFKDIIIKPLYGNGGFGIFRVKKGDKNFQSLVEILILNKLPIVVQRFLPEIEDGDRRVILIDGEYAGSVSRIPQQNEIRANFHAGGKAIKASLVNRDQEICDRLKLYIKERGLIFVGIDIIGDFLIEINVTSPTGIQEINRLNNLSLEKDIWDSIEVKISK